MHNNLIMLKKDLLKSIRDFVSFILIINVIGVGLAIAAYKPKTDYCKVEKDLCYGEPHIGCVNKKSGLKMDGTCPEGSQLVEITDEIKNQILFLHNSYREQVASGKLDNYETAAAMREMVWDDELEYLAKLNAKTCIFDHDQCRATYDYEFAGQNIGILEQNPTYCDVDEAIDILTGEWFNEHVNCNMDIIKFMPDDEEGDAEDEENQYAHFTQLVNDEAYAIGCGISKYDSGEKTILFVCNYAITSMVEEAVYATGPPASNCQNGPSATHPSLCA